MEERALRSMIAEVKTGRMSRRHFVQAMVGLGLTAPMAAQMLAAAGVAQAQSKAGVQADQARRRRRRSRPSGGRARPCSTRTSPSAPRIRTARASSTSRSPPGIRTATSRPILAAEIPSAQNGGIAKDGKSVTWHLKKGVVWHDGKPFTADDCLFTWEYVADPATASTNIGSYKDIKVEKVDSHTIRLVVPAAHAVLGGRLLRRARHDHPQAPVRGLQGRQVPRGADQSEAGGHRAVQVRGLQARRHGARRAESDLPHAQSPVLRHHRDEGRRRRGLGRPGRHPDGRGRLRLEHAGRGRDPEAHGAGRQGQGRHRAQAATSSTSSSTTPIRGRKSTASAPASRPSTRS